MERLACDVAVETPELPAARVHEPQIVMFWTGLGDAVVIAYFMENIAYAITDPHAVAVGPEISLRYAVHSPSGAAAAGTTLRKRVYRVRGLTQRKYVFSLRARKSDPARREPPARGGR
jgi:hypothetical protein